MLWLLQGTWQFAGRFPISSSRLRRTQMLSQDKRFAVMTIGAAGCGKSETGNTLLGKSSFPVSSMMEMKTMETCTGLLERKSMTCRVFDTAGFMGTSVKPAAIDNMMMPVAQTSEDGIDAFLLTLPYGRWGLENKEALRIFTENFGTPALKHTILVFTRCGEKTEADLVPEMKKVAPDVLDSLGNLSGMAPVVGMGDLTPQRRQYDQERLLRTIDLLSAQNGAPYDGVREGEKDRKKWSAFQKVKVRRSTYEERILKLSSPDLQTSLLKLLQRVRDGYLPEGDRTIAGMLMKANLNSGTDNEMAVTQELLKELRQLQLESAGAFARTRIVNFVQGAFSSIWDKLRSAASSS